MLRSAARAATPEIQLLVDEILNEESRFIMRERRDAARQPITRAVQIRPHNQQGMTFSALTRDISNLGVGIISQDPWERGIMARIEIDRLERRMVAVQAECRWCDQITEGWFLSGWHFVNVEVA